MLFFNKQKSNIDNINERMSINDLVGVMEKSSNRNWIALAAVIREICLAEGIDLDRPGMDERTPHNIS